MSTAFATSWLLAVTLAGVSVPDPHPLNDSEVARLETARDRAPTIDEAALYALLENASTWDDDHQPGAIVPDYAWLRSDPQASRGLRHLIEGTLYTVIEPKLSRRGWEDVQGMVIRVNDAHEPPRAEDFVIVYLTHPPQWHWRDRDKGVPWEMYARVRVVARFYKAAQFATAGASTPGAHAAQREYLAFVGRSAAIESPPPRDGTGLGMIGTFLVLVILLVLLIVWRLRVMAQGPVEPRRLRAHIEQRRHHHHDPQVESFDEGPTDATMLPEDPADALGDLADRHEPYRD